MHTSRDDYLINTLRFVSVKEETQIYGAILPKSLTSPEMKETKAYKTYFGFATGATPPKKARNFKKPTSPKLTTVLVSTKEPIRKSKRVKRYAKKSTQDPTRGVVIIETPEMPLSKKKEKVDVTGARSWGNDEDDSNNEQDSSDEENDSNDDMAQSDNENESDSEHKKDENESDSESDQEENEEDDEDDEEVEEEEVVKTPSNNSDDEDETKIADKAEGDEDEDGLYYKSAIR
ncbi:hypothetical protein Tco_1376458 [Tanacetum coccineum]